MLRIVIVFLFSPLLIKGQSITMTLEYNSEVWSANQPLELSISITNSTKKIVLIPNKASFYSNFLPNGLENPVYPAAIRFNLTPIDSLTAIFIENTTLVSTPKLYSKLRPGKTQVYTYNLAKHINEIIESDLSSLSNLLPSNTVNISATFGCFYGDDVDDDKRVIGTIKSNTISIKVLR